MRPIRILHVSDLHLAEQPERHSVIDKSGAVKKAVRDLLARDVKEAILSGQAKNIKPALQRFLDEESVAALVGAVSLVDRQKVNEAVDAALMRMMQSDFSFRDLSVQALKDLTIASSYNTAEYVQDHSQTSFSPKS